MPARPGGRSVGPPSALVDVNERSTASEPAKLAGQRRYPIIETARASLPIPGLDRIEPLKFTRFRFTRTRCQQRREVEDTATALGALYQSEKADASSIFNVAMAMMGIAATYIIGAISLVDKYGTDPFSWAIVVMLPAPLWLVAAYHSLITLNGMLRSRSVQIIEDVLFDMSGISQTQRGSIGTRSGDRIMDVQHSGLAHRAATAFVYAGVALSIVGYTVFAVVRSWEYLGSASRMLALAFYVLAILVVAGSWVVGLRTIGEPPNLQQCSTCRSWVANPAGDASGGHDQSPGR